MDISTNDRVFILSKLHAAVNLYYAHRQDAEQFDHDTVFQELISKALPAKDRYEFTLVMMEFIASLRNGHCWYVDDRVNEWIGQPTGFRMSWSGDIWYIENSRVEDLKPGDVVEFIDGETVTSFFNNRIKYLPAANIRQARVKLCESALLWPREFDLALADGGVVNIKRSLKPKEHPRVSGRWLKGGKVGFIRIDSFSPEEEADALALAREYRNADAIIIDLRNNGGGATPKKLIRYLMDRPYRCWTESTPVHFGLIRFICEYVQRNPAAKQVAEPLLMFNDAHLTWRSPLEQPEQDHYAGRLYFLVGPVCRSAGEDFIQPFKENGRGILLGETTFGSTGQPWFYEFGDGVRFFIGTKRVYFTDGTPFEGRGVAPDIHIAAALDDLAAGRDTVLEKAQELAGI